MPWREPKKSNKTGENLEGITYEEILNKLNLRLKIKDNTIRFWKGNKNAQNGARYSSQFLSCVGQEESV